ETASRVIPRKVPHGAHIGVATSMRDKHQHCGDIDDERQATEESQQPRLQLLQHQVRCSLSRLTYMSQANGNDLVHVLIVDGVVRDPSDLAVPHEPKLTQRTK